MNYRIEKKDGFRIVGISMPLEKEIEKNFAIVPQMWQRAAIDGTMEKLASLMEGTPMGLLGVSACNAQEEWKYYIAVTSQKPLEKDFEEYMIPASTWAIFSGEGKNTTIQELEKQIVTQWLPTSGYEYGDAADIEVYLNADPEHAKYEVWIPIVKK